MTCFADLYPYLDRGQTICPIFEAQTARLTSSRRQLLSYSHRRAPIHFLTGSGTALPSIIFLYKCESTRSYESSRYHASPWLVLLDREGSLCGVMCSVSSPLRQKVLQKVAASLDLELQFLFMKLHCFP